MLVDRAFVISLAIREDRLAAFKAASKNFQSIPEIEVWTAVHGDTCQPPEIWTAGAGAWGCVMPDTIVQGRPHSISRSKYSGYVFEVVSTSGHRATFTAKHPILTSRGFVAAEDLTESDELVCYQSGVKAGSAGYEVSNAPITADELFDSSVREGSVLRSKCVTSLDFYGDGRSMHGNVDVVSINRQLGRELNVPRRKFALQDILLRRHPSNAIGSLRGDSRCSASSQRELGSSFRRRSLLPETLGVIERDGKLRKHSAYFTGASPSYFSNSKYAQAVTQKKPNSLGVTVSSVGIGDASELDIARDEPVLQNLGRDATFGTELVNGFPASVSFDKVSKITRRFESSHVYDLFTDVGYFVAGSNGSGGLVVSNCYKSHLAILEHCLNTGVGSYLVFEDDAQFRTGFDEQLRAFMEVIPDGWQQAYIGGQLLHTDSHPTVKVKENVYRPYNVNRTHAFMVSRDGMLPMYQWISNLPFYQHEHIDHHLGRWHEDQRNRVYAPARWLVGQMGSSSNVSGKNEPAEFFTDPVDTSLSHWLYDDPVCVVFHGDKRILQKCRGYLHQGNQLDAHGYDVTLELASKLKDPVPYIEHWFGWIRGEVVRSNSRALPCLYHARITPDMLAQCKFKTVDLHATSVEQVKEFHEAFYAQR